MQATRISLQLLRSNTHLTANPSIDTWRDALSQLSSFELATSVDPNDLKGASVEIKARVKPFVWSAIRSRSGAWLNGVEVEKTVFKDGGFGTVLVGANSTFEGAYEANIGAKLYPEAQSSAHSSFAMSKKPEGTEITSSIEFGPISGSFVCSTEPNITSTYEVFLNTGGWATVEANGEIRDRNVVLNAINGNLNLGLISGSASTNGRMEVEKYEVGVTLGPLQGSIVTNVVPSKSSPSYVLGLSLGVVKVNGVFNAGSSTWMTDVDTGIFRLTHNHDHGKQFWKGTLELTNVGIDYEAQENGLSISGGWVQLGDSLLHVHRDNEGRFTIKVNKGIEYQP